MVAATKRWPRCSRRPRLHEEEDEVAALSCDEAFSRVPGHRHARSATTPGRDRRSCRDPSWPPRACARKWRPAAPGKRRSPARARTPAAASRQNERSTAKSCRCPWSAISAAGVSSGKCLILERSRVPSRHFDARPRLCARSALAHFKRMSFLTDLTPPTPRVTSIALLMSACERTKPLS